MGWEIFLSKGETDDNQNNDFLPTRCAATSITDEVMSDLFYWTHFVCYRQFLVSDTFILVSSSSALMRACVRACVRACSACVRAVRACVRAFATPIRDEHLTGNQL